jgi:PTS system nitrogen regulatory IIA component
MQLTVRDVTRLLNVSEKTIYRWISQGTLPAYRIQDQYRFNRAELLEWATSRRINVNPEIFREPEGESSPTPTLAESLEAGGIHYRIGGDDRPSVLRAIVEVMRLPEEVDREFLFRVLLAREELGSTAIGNGIAIPHPRNPIVLHVRKPSIALCFLERPIEFGALDGLPVHALFSLISSTSRAHLHLLSRLAFALNDSGFKRMVTRAGSRDEILGEARRVESKLKGLSPAGSPDGNAKGAGSTGGAASFAGPDTPRPEKAPRSGGPKPEKR